MRHKLKLYLFPTLLIISAVPTLGTPTVGLSLPFLQYETHTQYSNQ